MRWVADTESGERTRKEAPVRFRQWYWKDEQGRYMLDVRYGNRRLEVVPKKPTIEVGDAENLVPTLEALREVVGAGELDIVLMDVKARRRTGKRR